MITNKTFSKCHFSLHGKQFVVNLNLRKLSIGTQGLQIYFLVFVDSVKWPLKIEFSGLETFFFMCECQNWKLSLLKTLFFKWASKNKRQKAIEWKFVIFKPQKKEKTYRKHTYWMCSKNIFCSLHKLILVLDQGGEGISKLFGG